MGMSQVVIEMDPHKRSATIEVMAGDETVLGGGRYGTDGAGYRAMLAEARRWPQRVWAAGDARGSAGISRAGNRHINRVLHIMAVVQLRNPTEGRACYGRKVAAGKTPTEAMPPSNAGSPTSPAAR